MKRSEYAKLLTELSADLKSSVENIKQELSNAKSLYTRTKSYVENAQSIVDKITNEETGLDKVLTNAQTTESKITELKNSADTHLKSITDGLDSIKLHITEMETAYTKFTELNGKITNEETGLDKVLTNAQTTESKITELKNSADTHLKSITDGLDSIKLHITEMETAYTKFTELNGKITNEETGLDAILTQSVSLKSDIEANRDTSVTIFKEISKLKDTASGYTTDLKKMSETAKQTIGKITENHKESEDLKNKINSIWNISSQRLHANYFDARQKFLAKTAITWLVLFVVMFVLTLVLGDKYITPLVKIIESGEKEITQVVTFETLLIRLGLVTPSILATIYCLNQFSHERRLHEQYAFKAVSMLSVESSIELLIRSLSRNDKATDKDNRIVSFAVTTLESIYKDPIDSTKHSWLFRGGNKLLEMSVEMNESMGEIKSDIDQIKDITLKNKT